MPIELNLDDDREHVAELTIDAGDRNLVSSKTGRELAKIIESVPSSVSVLTISPNHLDSDITGLTAGLDLNSVRGLGVGEARNMLKNIHRSMAAVRNLDAVTICDCGTYALGFGTELAMSCDFRMATNDAELGLPEINVGLPTSIEGGLLIRLVGLAKAKELAFTGKIINGVEAEEIGLIHHAFKPKEYRSKKKELVDNLASKSPIIMQYQKQVFKTWRSLGIESGIKQSKDIAAISFDTEDTKEAMDAFLEDRKPRYRGI